MKAVCGSMLLLLVLVSCASTEIFEKADGNYSLIAHSFSESYAFSAAKEDGQKHCQALGKKFALVDQKTRYQGLDKNVKAGLGIVNSVIQLHTNNSNNSNNSNTYGDGSSGDDYRVEITFTCK